MTSTIKVDTISENTSANGVAVDGVTLKDGGITIANAGQIGSAGDADSIAIASNGVVTFSQAPVFPDGSIAVADLDIDGATDIGAAIVDADLFIIDDGAGGTNRKVTAARLKTYAGASSSFTEAVTITTADNLDTLSLISTDADAAVGPNLRFYRNSASPANNDLASTIDFEGRNNNSQDVVYGSIHSIIGDVTDGSEVGTMEINTMYNGTERSRISFGQTTTVFNEDSVDMDFRVESNAEANFFVIDAGNSVAGIGTTGSTVRFYVQNTNSSNTSFLVQNTASDNASVNADVTAVRAANSAYAFYRMNSSNGSDVEFNFRGDGEGFCDGSFSGGGADYAEYFEWKDGNSSDEDRIGYAVILDGTQIVKATDSDDASKIIGVISGNPAMVGDSAWNKWQEKHVTDDWNRYTYEDYTQTEWKDEDDKIVTYQTDLIPADVTVPDNAVVTSKDQNNDNLQRRVVNSNWDSTITYVPRSDRKEWDTVGLMGKLRLRKGQPTGTNWLKMRDISSDVEEWLVR